MQVMRFHIGAWEVKISNRENSKAGEVLEENGGCFQFAKTTHRLAHIFSVEDIKGTILARPKNQVHARGHYRRARPKILISIVLRLLIALRVQKGYEPI